MDAKQALSSEDAARLFAPLAGYRRLALAVSGGADSLALMHLAAGWGSARQSGPELVVLTVDHGLRAGSEDEAKMVAERAAEIGLPHAILVWSGGAASPGGLQERARTARYGLMAEFCHARRIPALVTAHHLDDQAETFLMRLKRGSGLDGLAAMPERSRWDGIEVLRPLLDVPKARLVATLAASGATWAEDPSNRDGRFERANLRAGLGALASLGLTPEALARSARRLRRARAALDDAAASFLREHATWSEAGYCRLPHEALISAPEEVGLRALNEAIAAVGGRTAPIQLVKLEALLAALKQTSGKTHTLGGCRLQPDADAIAVFRETRAAGLPELRLDPGQSGLWDHRFRIELGLDADCPIVVRALGERPLREARKNLPWLEALPSFAGRTLPSGWRGAELVFVPKPGLEFDRDQRGPRLSARFVHLDCFRGEPKGDRIVKEKGDVSLKEA